MPPSEATTAAEPGYWAWVPSAFSALRHRNYRLYWLGQGVSMIGTWMQRTAQGWLVTELVLLFVSRAQAAGPTNWYLAIVSASGMLPVLIFGFFTGFIADRFDKRRIIILTQTMMMVQAVILTTLYYTKLINIPLLVMLAIFLGLAAAVDMPARQGLVIELTGKKDLPNAIALNAGIFNGARMIGPAIAGILLAMHFTVGSAFLLNAVSFCAVLAALVMMRGDFTPRPDPDAPRQSALQRVVAGFRFILTTPGLRRVSIMLAVVSLLAAPFMPLLPSIARYQLGVGAARFGFLVACIGVGALSGALGLALLSAKRVYYTTLRTGYALLLGGLIALSFARSFWVAAVILAFVGLGFIWTFASTNTILQLRVPDHLRGRVMAAFSQLAMGMMPVGTLMMGALAKSIGVSYAILAGSGLAAAIGLCLFVLVRNDTLKLPTE